MITAENVMVEINGRNILKSVSYRFEQGLIYGIIGPNGAGKSTFLQAITGFSSYKSGNVYFKEKPLIQPDQKISVVWQKPYMFQTSVFKNVAYGLKVRHINKYEIQKKVTELLEQFHIEHLAHQKATELSGGETAKVAIARAIITTPDVLILDEPTASMDPKSVFEIEQIVRNIVSQWNMTVIMVTHNMFQAKRIADETLFFHSGSLIESNKTKLLFEQPIHELTQKFVTGELNF